MSDQVLILRQNARIGEMIDVGEVVRVGDIGEIVEVGSCWFGFQRREV